MNPDIQGQLTASVLMQKRIVVASGTQTAAGVDMQDFIENCKIIVLYADQPADGSTSMQYSILDSADNTTFAATAGLPTFAAVTAASGSMSVALDTRNCRRYVQLKALTSSTTATNTTAAVLVGLKQVT